MQGKSNHVYHLIDYVPPVGIAVFAGLYLYAVTLYPGGSQADMSYEGFDWVHNYWCNLMSDEAVNGLPNPARPYSVFAWIVLCISLMVFCIQFARRYCDSSVWKIIIVASAIMSVSSAILIFTTWHDEMIIVSSFFGLFVLVGMIKEMRKRASNRHRTGGLIGLVLMALNNYIYYSGHYIEVLPLLQKVTFAFVLIWIASLSLAMRKMDR